MTIEADGKSENFLFFPLFTCGEHAAKWMIVLLPWTSELTIEFEAVREQGGHNCAYRLRSNVNSTFGSTRIRSTIFWSTLF